MKQKTITLPSPKNGDILISIQNEFAQKIYDGTKTIELRKHLPPLDCFTYCWIYEPKPIGVITGYFVVSGTIACRPKQLWDEYHEVLGLDWDRYSVYYYNRDLAYGIVINCANKLPQPYTLQDFGLSRPPQMYQRITTL